jgi:putative oxidoreductase
VTDSANHIARLKGFGIPFPAGAFWSGLAIQLLGCLLILTRWHSAAGAICLIAFTLAATAIYHRFWTKGDPVQRIMSRIILIGNVAIIGGLMLVWAIG